MNTQALNVARQRIIGAIRKIGVKLPTQSRAYVDSYLGHVNPSLATRGDSMFPMSLRRHPANPDRQVVESQRAALCFAIGNAIGTYYDAVNGIEGEELERRIKLIESIAEHGLSQFILVGDVRSGFALERRPHDADKTPAPAATPPLRTDDERLQSKAVARNPKSGRVSD